MKIVLTIFAVLTGLTCYSQTISINQTWNGNAVQLDCNFNSISDVGSYSFLIYYDHTKLTLSTVLNNEINANGMFFGAPVSADTIQIEWVDIMGFSPLISTMPITLHFTAIQNGCSWVKWVPVLCQIYLETGTILTPVYQDAYLCYSSGPSLVFHEDFEDPSYGDSLQPTATSTPYNYDTAIHSQGYYSALIGVPNGASDEFITTSFSTLGYNSIILSFDQICKIDYNDTAKLYVSTDGVNWTLLTVSQLLTGPQYGNSNASNALHFAQYDNGFCSSFYSLDWQAALPSVTPQNSWWRTTGFNCSAFLSNSPHAYVKFKISDLNTPGSIGYGWSVDNIKITGDFVVGENKAKVSQVGVYPNPTKDVLYFASLVDEIYVFDLVGNLVFAQKNTKSVDLRALGSGTYYIKCGNKGETTAIKIIKL